MTYSPRPRRFRKIAQYRAKTLGLITARQFLTNQGVPAAVADRFAGAFSRVVKKLGAAPTSATWTKRNGRARKTLAYNPATDLGALLGAFLTYAPGGKTKAARAAARAEWDGYRYGRRTLATV
ncbi:hypothetical protein ACFYPC_09670 [Streptomyces sp. NPDC005808]|uniref:hypothetical protein n=1 Tax=Streptomyces sp. NPDC005808 TaxID=3364734 RepID=UPI00367C3F95